MSNGTKDRPSVRAAAAQDRPAVIGIAGSAEFAPLRYMAIFGHDIGAQEQRDRIGRRLESDVLQFVATDGDRVVGHLGARRIEDLETHFGVRVVEAGPVLVHGDRTADRSAVAAALLGAAVDEVAEGTPTLTMLRVEADDLAALHAAEATGFRIMETSVSWVNDLERRHLNQFEEPRGVEVIDLRTASPSELSRLEPFRTWGNEVMSLDHYHADPRLPSELCDSLYLRRLERAMRGEGADVAVMGYADDGTLVGGGFWRICSEYEPYGVAMVGDGYGFRLPGAPSKHTESFTDYICNNSLTGNRLLEWTTQVSNYPQVNMTSRPRSIRLVRSSMMLHHWSG